MSIFIGNLLGFAVIMWIMWKFVLPVVRRMMTTQKQTVRTQLDDNAAAAARLARADQHYAGRVAQAKADAKHIVDEARVDAERIVEQLRAQADTEMERIKVQGEQQVELLRTQLIRQLRHDLGGESVRRAGDLVREHLNDAQARAATIDRFLDELDSMAPAAAAPQIASDLRSASRQSQAALVEQFDTIAAELSSEALHTLSEECTAVARLLMHEPILARHLAEASGTSMDKNGANHAKDHLLQRVLATKITGTTMDLLRAAVAMRWSTTNNFVDALGHISHLALLVCADRDNQAHDIEEQLFRFSRILDEQPKLSSLLGDCSRPASGRVALLGNVLRRAGVANTTLIAILSSVVELSRGQRMDEAVQQLAELAVARRGEIVAHVDVASGLTDAQHIRLTQILTRIYHQPVSVQLTINPELLGGICIAVGDEVIDGTVSTRLSAARNALPD